MKTLKMQRSKSKLIGLAIALLLAITAFAAISGIANAEQDDSAEVQDNATVEQACVADQHEADDAEEVDGIEAEEPESTEAEEVEAVEAEEIEGDETEKANADIDDEALAPESTLKNSKQIINDTLPENIYVIGEHSGWDFAASPTIQYQDDRQYVGTINLVGDFKICPYYGSWNIEYGQIEATWETKTVPLQNHSDNIKINQAGKYVLTVTFPDETLSDNPTLTWIYQGPVNVTFDYNYEGCPESKTITETTGSGYTWPEQPTRDFYMFQGWYTQKEGGNLIKTWYLPATETPYTLYAHWAKRTDASYYANGDHNSWDFSANNCKINYDATKGYWWASFTDQGTPLNFNTLKLSNYKSWGVNEWVTNGNVLALDTIYTPIFNVESGENIQFQKSGHCDFCIIETDNYKQPILVVSEDLSSCKAFTKVKFANIPEDSEELGVGAVKGYKTHKVVVPTKEGYTFEGYFTEPQESNANATKIIDENGVCLNNWESEESDVTLYAHWSSQEPTPAPTPTPSEDTSAVSTSASSTGSTGDTNTLPLAIITSALAIAATVVLANRRKFNF